MPRKRVSGGRRFPVSLRVTEEARAQLGTVAAARGRSLAAEVEARLEASLQTEDQAGGHEIVGLARIWTEAFRRGLALGAKVCGLPTADDALRSSDAYAVAVHFAADALLAAGPFELPPDLTREQLEQVREAQQLIDFFARAAARGASVKIRSGR